MGFFDSGNAKEPIAALTPHGRECLETDAVELNRAENDIMWYLKENSAKPLKTIARGVAQNYTTTRYIINDLAKKKLVEYIQ